jgi:hypothetical protein
LIQNRPLELFMLFEVPPYGTTEPDPKLVYLQTMLGIDVGAPPLPIKETRPEFMKRYAEDSGRRLERLRATSECWWEELTSFFDVKRSRAWVMTRRLTHTSHHRGQH